MKDHVQRLKDVDIPRLFEQPDGIGRYGRTADSAAVTEQVSKVLGAAPAAQLADKLSEIIDRLSDADPQRVSKPSTWLERLTGWTVEVQVRYQMARRQLDDLIVDAEVRAQSLRDAVGAMDVLMSRHGADVTELQVHIQAGREYLVEHPHAGRPDATTLEFDNVRERFARRLANLVTLLASSEMSNTQLKLARAQAVDLLDRFEETARVLVPVWRQHTLALATASNMGAGLVAEATKAHDALLSSLARGLNAIER